MMFWTDSQAHGIFSADYNGINPTRLVPDLDSPQGLALVTVPEPASVGLIGAGALLLLKKTRQHKQ